jgi:nucleoside-diphosphate-sugar epimerase
VITGGAGFLGSHVVDYFVEQSVETVVVDDFSEGRHENLSNALDSPLLEISEADLTDREETFEVFADVDYIVHLAAKIGGIGYFHDIPADIISLNDAMNRNVMDASVAHDIERFVYASSSMVYENATDFPIDESQIGRIPPPDSAYGFQKLAGEYYCRAYHDQHDLEYAIFRPFNAVGPREPPGEEVGQAHVIPDFVLKILEEEQYPLTVLGDGKQVRSFTNVRDIAKGVYMCTFDSGAENEDFNLGSTESITMRELAKRLWDLCDRKKDFEFDTGTGYQHDVKRRVPDSSKARDVLDWESEISLDESLSQYLAWYRQTVLD